MEVESEERGVFRSSVLKSQTSVIREIKVENKKQKTKQNKTKAVLSKGRNTKENFTT